MKRLWPWETRRLGPHRYVTRPWRPHEDRRVRAVTVVLVGSVAAAGVWRLQGDEAGHLAHGTAAGLAAGVAMWAWRAWRR